METGYKAFRRCWRVREEGKPVDTGNPQRCSEAFEALTIACKGHEVERLLPPCDSFRAALRAFDGRDPDKIPRSNGAGDADDVPAIVVGLAVEIGKRP
jgi:hypothetical protein